MYKISEVHVRLLGTNGFHANAKNERFTAAGSRYSQNLEMKILRRHLAGFVKKLDQKACGTCNTIIFPQSTNEIIEL